MPSERPVERLRDIRDNIRRIRAHTDGLTEETFLRNPMAVDAVERCLERIAEAARKLGDRYDATYPDVGLPELRRLGSKLRHDYDQIRPEMLWRIVLHRLQSLDDFARTELDQRSDG